MGIVDTHHILKGIEYRSRDLTAVHENQTYFIIIYA